MKSKLTFGLTTFGDMAVSTQPGPEDFKKSISNIVIEALLADQLNVDFFGVGEHHRPDFSVSAPEIVLASIAGKTERVRVGTAATVLPTDDPVRLFQRFATLDAISSGRAELILGRGWFNESFKLFGLDPAISSNLFELKLDRFRSIILGSKGTSNENGPDAISRALIYPRMTFDPRRIWVAVGSTPESAIRAARFGFPMMLAVIGGPPSRFKPMIDIYRLACEKLNKSPMEVGVHSSGYVASTDDQAKEEFWPYYENQRNRLGTNRGWPIFTKANFDTEVAIGSLFVGSSTTVARKIADMMRTLDCTRIHIKYSCGEMPHEKLMRSIEIFGSEVFPLVRKYLSS